MAYLTSTVESTLFGLIEKHTLPEVINWVRRLVEDELRDAESGSDTKTALLKLELLLGNAVYQAFEIAEIQQRENDRPSKRQKAKRRIKVRVG